MPDFNVEAVCFNILKRRVINSYVPCPVTASMRRRRNAGRAVCAAVVFGLGLTALAQTNTNRFGFTGPEIFPIDNVIGLLHAADLDGDGLNDLIVVNNARSKINLLYNQTGKTNLAATLKPRSSASRTNCRPTRGFASSPSPRRNASPRWWWPTSTATAGPTSPITASRRN